MKWIALIGRLGMVILMTGLALGLISLIPSVQTTPSSSNGMTYLQPERYDFLYGYSQLTPQSGIRISIESNSSVDIYLLGIEMGVFQNWTTTWVTQQFPNLNEPVWTATFNVTVLNAFLESHSGAVLWESGSSESISKEFYPSTASNLTGIIANPSVDLAQYTFEVTSMTSIAPKAKVILLSELLIPLGVALAIPWAYSTRVRKPELQ